jgi:predicted transcriptional regulator
MFTLSQLKHARQKLGLTQAQLARQAGLSQSLIAKIEAGKLDPKYSTVQRLEETIALLQGKDQPTVKEVMQRHLLSARLDDRVPQLIKRMQQAGISQVPVMEGRHVAGLITEATLLQAISEGSPISKLTAKEVMADAPPIIPSTTPLAAAVQLLEHTAIIIVTERGAIAGIVTRSDLLKAAA